ncbi:Na(+)/H(+) exchanger beta-like [Lingula anatina]|uniref:Sodium/hydrogen exchanger n=1 Tax=Lingula anatina TaxID=7574 RepID=A0A2R2MRJ1_LINAN|nr:Na(+)/H(+) exchanger beta-like [Lingula anatina]|eukprot:XP_023932871.1 Na(+)/H(+) exchanger beta-like [Lingula anatina]
MTMEVLGQNKTHMGTFEGTCFKQRTMAGKWTVRCCVTVAAWTRRCFKVSRLRQPLLLLMLVIMSLLVPCYASQPDVVHYNKPGTEKDMHFWFHGNESKNSTHDRTHYPKVNWHEEGHGGIHVAAWNFQHVKAPLVIVMFTTVAALCKLGFHHANFLSSIVPESCLLIVLGTVLGGILTGAGADFFPTSLPPDVFFLYLLPPIILESAYSLYDRTFFDNVGTVMFYAVIGTVINCFLIGPTLYGLMSVGAMGDDFSVTFVQCLLFSALIVAVDPVAVLAIFQEIGVNQTLYFLVFGESLFNDAVTVVLYNTMKAFNAMPPEDINVGQVFLAVAAFFVVSLGGAVLGILFGALSSVITKYTEHVRVVEPLTILLLAYLSYLSAELFHFSGIIGICCCGLMQAHYAFNNISHKSLTTVTYFSKMLSTASDCMIFMFLGLTLVRPDHDWHTGFTLWTLFLCLVIRFMSVFGLTLIANKLYRLRKIELEEQFIMVRQSMIL